MNIIYQRFSLPLIILLLASFASCRQESLYSPGDKDYNGKSVELSFSLDENRSTIEESSSGQKLKAADDSQLSSDNIKILLFKQDNNKTETFRYKPNAVTLTKISNNENSPKQSYIAKFVIPKDLASDASTPIKMVVMANYKGQDPTKNQTYAEFNKTLIVGLHGKYDETKNPIPLWGNCNLTFDSSEKIMRAHVSLLRSMAKIRLSIATDQRSDAKYKIESIESVRVYHSLDKATLYVGEGNGEVNENREIIKVTKPTIPSDAKFNLNNGTSSSKMSDADAQPLLYDGQNGNPAATSLIFVPEKQQSAKPVTAKSLEEAMAIVVGVKLKDKNDKVIDKIRYFRVDIAEYDLANKKLLPTRLISVLRNHGYNIKLQGVSNSGGNTPDDALKGNPSIYVVVKDWENEFLDYDINGQYIFGIQSSNLQLPWKKDSLEIPITYTLTPENAKKAFSFSWKDSKENVAKESQIFKAVFDMKNRKLIVFTKQDNQKNNDITEQLSVRFLKHSFTFKVTQLHKSAQYTIGPETTVKGVYVYGKPNPSNNKVTFRLYAKKLSNGQYAKLDGLKFHVASDTIEGYSIVKDGTFNALITPKDGSAPYQVVTAQVSGIATQPKDKILTLKTDADQHTYAKVTIPLAFRPKKVLVLYGDGVPNEDRLYTHNKDFKKLMDGNGTIKGVNFGLDTLSVVKAETITFVETTNEDLASVINSEHPDIIIHSKGYKLDQQAEDAIIKFMNSNPTSISGRGVFISTNTENVHNLLKVRLGLFSQNKFEGRWMEDTWYEKKDDDKALHYTGLRDLFPIREYPPGKNGENINLGYRYRITNAAKDKLINGAFGDIGGLWWRAGNGTNGLCITFPIKDKILQYSGMVPFASGATDRIRERYDYGATFLRAKSYPLVWIGFDNIGLSKGTEGQNDSGNPYDVYAWKFDDKGKSINFPIGTYYCTEEGLEPNYASIVSTGIVLGNMLYWALYTSEYGI